VPTEDLDVVVVVPDEHGSPAPGFLAARTVRALARGGAQARRADVVPIADLAARLASARRPVWLLRAGATPLEGLARPPPPSATGRTLLAVGATRDEAGACAPAWDALVRETGGDLGRAAELAARLPRLDSVVIEEPRRLAVRLEEAPDLDAACAALARHPATRVVRLRPLDVARDAALCVVLVVTTLHRGGAERVVVELVRELRAEGAVVTLAVLDRASRAVLDAPDGTVFLADAVPGASRPPRASRIEALASLVRDADADVVHVHLADGAEIRKLAASVDVPIVLTLHNDRPGWAAHTTELGPDDVALVLACSADVAHAFAAAVPSLAARTRVAWNGIRAEAGRAGGLRAELGIPEGAPLLVTVANHRPQKRLEAIPAVVAELGSRGIAAHAVVVGEPVSADPVAREVASLVRAASESLGVAKRVHVAGTRPEAADLLGDASVVLSASAFEGLSLVHLEAMRARVPLVTTAVSGTREIADLHAGVWRVDEGEELPARLASAVAEALAPAAPRPSGLAAPFTSAAMGARHAELLAAAASARTPRRGLVLVANNFATGGAQSSARRLLVALHAAGVPVAACVLEEQAGWPTAGRTALERAGVPVFVAPRAGSVDPAVTADAVARFVEARAPESVVFWNAITQHKVLVAERVASAAVWDVSPGEMYFTSLERYMERPRAGHPVRDARAYGRMLAGVVVKYEAERARAEEVLGVPVHVIPNGVPLGEDVRPRPRPTASPRRVVVGTLARINPDKKLDELVRAVRRAVETDEALAARLEVRIAGPVEQGCEAHEAELRALAAGLPIAFVGEQDARAFLGDLDLYAMISEPSGCPNASLEAMAAGLPVVATDVGGAREQILHGETGLLAPRGDALALGDALARLANDDDARSRMGAAALARARDAFAESLMVARYRALLLPTST
jgi:glycosyltransferase involved in cell wall biosynthesis